MDTILNANKNIFGLSQFLWAISPESLFTYNPIFVSLLTGSIHSSIKDSERLPQANINILFDSNNNQISPSRDSADIPENTVAVVRLVGPMFKYGNYYFWGSDEITAILRYYDNHPNVLGIVLQVDTGGGQVAAVAPYKDFFENKKKPVVALCDVSASAGLWVTSYTDYVFAENNISSMFGSLGIMANYTSFAKYFEDLGVKKHKIVSSHSEDKGKAFDLAMEGKYDMIKKELLDPLAITFQNEYKANTPNLKVDTPGLLTGKIFYADDAISNGMVNEVGNMLSAVTKVRELAAISNFMITN